MKLKLLIGILIISLFLISGCGDIDLSKLSDEDLERVSEKLIVCEEFYIRHEAGCCLDKNENKICDKDEKVETCETCEVCDGDVIPEKCVISTGSDLFCDDFSIDDMDNVRLNVHNILNEDITGVIVTLTNPAGGVCANAVGVDVGADTTAVVALACTTSLVEKVKADLSVTYTVGGFTKTTYGTLIGKIP